MGEIRAFKPRRQPDDFANLRTIGWRACAIVRHGTDRVESNSQMRSSSWRDGRFHGSNDGDLAFRIDTADGLLRIGGNGALPFGGTPSFHGAVEGDPALVGRLPTVLDGIAFIGDEPGKVELVID